MHNHARLIFTAMLISALVAFAQENPCLKKAQQAMRIENYEGALATLRTCDQTSETFRLKGICFHRLYNADSALACFSKATAPVDDTVLLNGAEALLWKKEFKQAGEWLENVSDKKGSPYRNVHALRLEMVGKFADAIILYDSMIASEKQPLATLVRKGEVLSWMKKYDQAIALFNTVSATENAPKTLRMYALIRRAEVRAWQRNSTLALNELDTIIAMEGKPMQAARGVKDRILEALRIKGTVLEWDGRYKEARDTYKNMLLLDPDNKQAKLLLEKLLWVK